MATIMAFSTSADICNAAAMAPPEETPAKIPSSEANARVNFSAVAWLISMILSTRSG